jgi:hypothetical protein
VSFTISSVGINSHVRNSRFVPRYFEQDIVDGYAVLTPEGRKAVEEELEEVSESCIEGPEDAKLSPYS